MHPNEHFLLLKLLLNLFPHYKCLTQETQFRLYFFFLALALYALMNTRADRNRNALMYSGPALQVT